MLSVGTVGGVLPSPRADELRGAGKCYFISPGFYEIRIVEF
ncbi:hypothetical protein CSB85_2353 [Pseudomonas aeruginosa]|nr:hypothetical protein CSB85_2353 [Pseudomonas aeruginosa]